jgi:branched-chain amino acid transport system permease protein
VYYLQIALLGIAVGCIYALSATGIVLTYSATGVFNIAHFAVALLAAYLGWQLNGVWGLPLGLTVPIVLVVCGPGVGLLLERAIFRPLQVRGASSSERLVAALGVTVLILGVINIVWGPGVQGTVDEPVPRLFPLTTFSLGTLIFDYEQVGTMVVTVLVAGSLFWLLRRTLPGLQIRAVVDRRELAQLAAIDANRTSQVAWSLGCAIAALTGMIIAQGTLEPTRIIFFGIETFSVAVVARLVSIPVAIGFGFFAMGLGRSLMDAFEPFGSTGTMADVYQAMVTNLSTLVLFVVLVAYKRLDETGAKERTSEVLVARAFGRRAGGPGRHVWPAVTAAALVAMPLVLDGAALRQGHQFLALAVIFISIVAITGFSGHLTLGQASIAGLGAFASARFANAFDLPVLAAMVPGAAVAVAAGFLAGYPALRRRGLFLGLTTLALALLIDRFVFNERIFQGGPGGLTVVRPTLFGLDLSGDVAFAYYQLVVLALVVVAARNLRRGRLGRILGAMRDSEPAAQSVGIELRRAKLFVFGVSSAMAALGGALLTQANQTWDTVTFNPVLGLFWFTAVVVAGISSVGGAILAAALFVFIPYLADLDVTSAAGFFGVGAVLLGRMPGGLVGLLRRAAAGARDRVLDAYDDARRPLAPEEPTPVPSELAQRILAEQAGRGGGR